MRQVLKKIMVMVLSASLLVPLWSTNAFSQTIKQDYDIIATGKDKKVEEYSFDEIESIIVKYLKDTNKNYPIGTIEFENYLRDFLFGKDTNINDIKTINLINAYAAKYLDEVSRGNIISNINLNAANDSVTNSFKSKKIKDIKAETLKKENEAKANLLNDQIKDSSKSNIGVNFYSGYSYSNARSYAINYALSYNSNFPSWSSDCTNFVSQVLNAGGISMNSFSTPGINTDTSKWYCGWIYTPNPGGYPALKKESASTTTWINATDFYNYWSARVSVRDGRYKDDIIPYAEVGDIIQYYEINTGIKWHSIFVSDIVSGDLRICQHTSDRQQDLWKATVGPIPDHNGSETYFKLLKFR